MEGSGVPVSLGPVVDPSLGALTAAVEENPVPEAAADTAVEEEACVRDSELELFERPLQQAIQPGGDLGTAEIEEREEGAEEEQFPSSRDIPSGGVRPPESIIDMSEWRCHILHHERLVRVDLLCFDKSAKHGQVRLLHPEIVKCYVQRLIAMG